MSEPMPTYTTVSKRGNRLEYQLTELEAALVEFYRNNCHGRWVGTIIYDESTDTIQLFSGKKAGIVNGRN